MACEAEEAGYNAAQAEADAKQEALQAAQEEFYSNPTPNNQSRLNTAWADAQAAAMAACAAYMVWQNCLNSPSGTGVN